MLRSLKSRIFSLPRRIIYCYRTNADVSEAVLHDTVSTEGDFMQDYVVLINLDDGVCHALARRLRAEGVYCRIMPAGATADEIPK